MNGIMRVPPLSPPFYYKGHAGTVLPFVRSGG